MSAKSLVAEYVENNERFTANEAAEALGLNISTVRKAIKSLVDEGVLSRDENTLVRPVVTAPVTRTHSKPKVADILQPKFDAALVGVNVIISGDADERRAQKLVIKNALAVVTVENTKPQVLAVKSFSAYSEEQLAWYKSRYLRDRRQNETPVVETVETDSVPADVNLEDYTATPETTDSVVDAPVDEQENDASSVG